jgi:hypothetical protein
LVAGGCLGALVFWIAASIVGGVIGGLLGLDRNFEGKLLLALVNLGAIILGGWYGMKRVRAKH